MDGGDCDDCLVDDPSIIGDGNCDIIEYNTTDVDGADLIAQVDNIKKKEWNACTPTISLNPARELLIFELLHKH